MSCCKEYIIKLIYLPEKLLLPLPKDFTCCFVIAYIYITTFSLIVQSSSKLAENDRGKMVSVDNDYGRVIVQDISNNVLWNCRTISPWRKYYQSLFAFLVIALLMAFLYTAIRLAYKGTYSNWIGLVQSVTLRISLFLALTTYDVSIWGCIFGSSQITYSKETGRVDLDFKKSVMNYQLAGSVFSCVFLLICSILSCKCLCRNNRCYKRQQYSEL